MFLIFDTETTGLPIDSSKSFKDIDNWPRCIQIAWQLHDKYGELINKKSFIIKPDGFDIPFEAEKIHGITTKLAENIGIDIKDALNEFNKDIEKSTYVVGHNIEFDINIILCEFYRLHINNNLENKINLETCSEETAKLCKLSGGKNNRFKLPTLSELYLNLFNSEFGLAHNASADVQANARAFFELIRNNFFQDDVSSIENDYLNNFQEQNPEIIKSVQVKHIDLHKKSKELESALKNKNQKSAEGIDKDSPDISKSNFIHLHNHSKFSVLSGYMDLNKLIKKTAEFNMKAVAITDSGNLMGAFEFIQKTNKYNKDNDTDIKPIIGLEINICSNHLDKTKKDNGNSVVLLAKNKEGYKNLVKLSSKSYTDGFYYVPRVDKNLIEKYKNDLIVLSGNKFGLIPNKILAIGEKQAEEELVWWKDTFKENFYLELCRHGEEAEERVNDSIIKFSEKHKVKVVATNDNYYIEQDDSILQDMLVCVRDNEKLETPKGRGRGFRYGLPNDEYYFKSSEQMRSIFSDIPEAIVNTEEIFNQIEYYNLEQDVLLPKFNIPTNFNTNQKSDNSLEHEYLIHLANQGAKEIYGDLTDEINERLEFELLTIKNSGYSGYFLIVRDIIKKSKEMNVSVGPGRGSAAGSLVAYCTGITSIDPLKYGLLFERFLNPDRISMPDIDIDFEDEGRQKVIDYIIESYGQEKVAQIITYGTMAAKSAVRDSTRVLDLPLDIANNLAKLIPVGVGVPKLKDLLDKSPSELLKTGSIKRNNLESVKMLQNFVAMNGNEARVLNHAKRLEGSLRNTGVHACGIVITPTALIEHVPLARAKESSLFVTQYDNNLVEKAGLLKMDILGLKTLGLIKGACKTIKETKGEEIDIDNIPLDDSNSYNIFKNGNTIGIFQYESPEMQKFLIELSPSLFEDLIAMNALYRPGPKEYIPSFIKRKHGKEEIKYDLDDCKDILEETYGITVYQEQVMRLSQKIANFSRGEADQLRKAMGKKIFSLLDELKGKFIERGINNGHNTEGLEKIWKDWEAFASYAFNKSHATCYAWIAYQTAYLKANYPEEFMASVLSNNMQETKSLRFFINECKRMKIEVLGPDINESFQKFTVNNDEQIRFGLSGVKGIGSSAVESLIAERKKNGKFKSAFDLCQRCDLRVVNKKTLESLVISGAFDAFDNIHRAQYLFQNDNSPTFIEKIMKIANKISENESSNQISMFELAGVKEDNFEIKPEECEEWGGMQKLNLEKEVLGIFISGHPLDNYRPALKNFCNISMDNIKNIDNLKGKELTMGGILSKVEHRISKNGNGYSLFSLEDLSGIKEFFLFGETYLKFKHLLSIGTMVYIKAIVTSRYNNPNDMEIKINNIQLLKDVFDSFANKIQIKIDLNNLNNDFIESLNNIIDNFNGKKRLEFELSDSSNNLSLKLRSRKQKVNINSEFVQTLEDNQIGYQIFK